MARPPILGPISSKECSHLVLQSTRQKERPLRPFLDEDLCESNNSLKPRNTDLLTPGRNERPQSVPGESRGPPTGVRNGTRGEVEVSVVISDRVRERVKFRKKKKRQFPFGVGKIT